MFSNEQLTSPDFDEVAYLRYALRASSFSTEHARLLRCIAEVKDGMQSILAEHADELIDQARCTYKAQREVSSVRQSTDSLQKAAGRLRLMIEEPYTQLQSRVRELEATQEVMQLLQSTLRFLSLTGRLQEQLAATPNLDIIRASYTLRELEEVLQEDSIRSLQVVDAQLTAVERYATTIRSKAHDLLAMTELTSAPNPGGSAAASTSRLAVNVSTGLQCAYVLRMLSRTVQGFMTERRREVLRTVMRELDAQTIEEHISADYERLSRAPQTSGSGAGCVSEQAVTSHVVLEHIQKTLFTAVQHTQCVILLWRLILQKRDALTQAPYLAAIESPLQLLVEYWTTITEKMRERLSSLQKRHAIRLALASAYPRFHYLIASFLSRTDTAGTTGAPVGNGASASASSGGGGGLAALPAAALASSIHVSQCGMGDFLDLIDLVDAVLRTSINSNCSSHHSAADGSDFTKAGPSSLLVSLQPHAGSAVPRTDTQDLRHTWLAQVTDDVRDAFRTYVMDRHRELISGVLARLSNMLPASPAMCGQPAAVAPVRMQGIRRPAIPPLANALDLAAYTRMVTQEVQVFRQDPHTLDVLLDCVLTSLHQLRGKFGDAVKKFALPPLPAITAAPTLVQVLHLCIANGCTTLAYDCTTVLACIPQATTWASSRGGGGSGDISDAVENDGHSYGGGGCADPYTAVLERLSSKRVELQQLIHAFHEMSERSTKPFVDSAMAVLLPTLTQVTDNVLRSELATSVAAAAAADKSRAPPLVGGDSRTALVQLQSQCRQFTDRFFFLVDARTSGWLEACQHMTDVLLARLLARVATTPPPPQLCGNVVATAPAYAHALQLLMPVLLQYVQVIQSAGAVGRTTSVLRGCVRQMEGFYEACGGLSADVASSSAAGLHVAVAERLRPPLPVFFAKLLVLQYALLSRPPAPHDDRAAAATVTLAAAMKLSDQAAVESVETALLRESASAIEPPSPSSAASSVEKEDSGRKAEVEKAVGMCFGQALAEASADFASRLQEMWALAEAK